eukprot:gene24202-32631_t
MIHAHEYIAVCRNIFQQQRFSGILAAQIIRIYNQKFGPNSYRISSVYEDYIFFRLAKKVDYIKEARDSIESKLLIRDNSSLLRHLDSRIVAADEYYKEIQREIKFCRESIKEIESNDSPTNPAANQQSLKTGRRKGSRKFWHNIAKSEIKASSTRRPLLSFRVFEENCFLNNSLADTNFVAAVTRDGADVDGLILKSFSALSHNLDTCNYDRKPETIETIDIKSPLAEAIDIIRSFKMPPLVVKVKEKKKIASFTPATLATIPEASGKAKFTAQESEQDEDNNSAVSSISNSFNVSSFTTEALTSTQPVPASAPPPPFQSTSNPTQLSLFPIQPSPAPSELLQNSAVEKAIALKPEPTIGAQAVAPSLANDEVVTDTTKIYNRILEIYQEHNPKKLSSIPKLLEDYKGREDVLLEKMEQKYLKSSSLPASSTSTSAPSNTLFSPPPQTTSNTPTPSLLQSTSNNVISGTPTPFAIGGTNAPVSSLFGSTNKAGGLPLPTLNSIGKTPSPGLLSAATAGASLNLTSNQNQQQQPASLFSPAAVQTSVFRPRAGSGLSPSTVVPGASLFGGPKTASIQQPSPFSASSTNLLGANNTTTGPLSQQELWQRVNAIYLKHNPAKVSEIPYILEKYKGNELQLLANLEKKYNLSSSTGSTSNPSSISSSGVSPFGPAQPASGSLFGNMGGQSHSNGNNLFGQQQQQQSLFGSPSGGFPTQQQQQQQPSFGTGAGMGGSNALFSGLRNTNPAGATPSLFGGAGANLNPNSSPSGGSLFGRQNTGNPTVFGSGSSFGTANNALQMWRQ